MKELYDVAKQFGMTLADPYWPEDLNAWVFETGQMNDDSTWRHHKFYLVGSASECLTCKLAAFAAKREDPEASGWCDCATPDCGAQVRVSGSRCSACRACEELGFGVQPPEERLSHDTRHSDDPTYGQFHL